MRNLSLLFLLAACSDTAPIEPIVIPFPGDRVLDPLEDEDGDGLTNGEEEEGWILALNVTGYGDDFQSVHVFSDPLVPDTDGDGMTDLEERLYRSDPRLVDSDGDGLTDPEEVFRWSTSPTHVDTDEDSRGSDPDFLQPPLAALFDGWELDLHEVDGRWIPGPGATSPTLEDTDGDGLSDYEETQSARRHPAVAELPEVRVQISPGSAVDLSVDIVYSDETIEAETLSTSTGVDRGYAQESGEVASASVYVDVSNKTTISGSVTGGCCSDILSGSARVENTTASTTRLSGAYELSFDESQSRDSHEAWSETQQRTVTNDHTFESARVQLSIDLTNPTARAFNVERLSFVAFAQDGYTRKPFAIVRPEATVVNGLPTLPTYTLGPGEQLNGIVLTDVDADTGWVYELMSDPDRVLLSPASYGLTDADGVDFDFQLDVVRERTSRISINWGEGVVEHLDVATNVDRDDQGRRAGMPIRTFLDLAGVDYVFEDVGGSPHVRLDDRATTLHNEPPLDFTAVLDDPGYPTAGAPGARQVRSSWHVYLDRYDGSSADQVLADWADLVVQPGDTVLLVYGSDADQDGIVDGEEAQHGSSDHQIDTDGDGLSDYWEIRQGWMVSTDLVAPYEVHADPTHADRDEDGLTDLEEYQLGTDPRRRDTDADGFPDGAEASAIDLAQSPTIWDEPSTMWACCQVHPDGVHYVVAGIDDDLDASEFTFVPGNPSPPESLVSDVVHEGAHWALFEIPRPLLWSSVVTVRDALGQEHANACPLPGIDDDNFWGCPTPPPLADFGL